MSKRTTFEKFWQKRPPLSGGTLGQVTHGTCRLGRSRQGGATVANAGRWPTDDSAAVAVRVAGHAAWVETGMSTWRRATNGGGGTLAADSISRPPTPDALIPTPDCTDSHA
jgi:hypothetical protein